MIPPSSERKYTVVIAQKHTVVNQPLYAVVNPVEYAVVITYRFEDQRSWPQEGSADHQEQR